MNRWIPSKHGFKRYQFEHEKPDLQLPLKSMMATDTKGKLWIVSYGQTLFCFDPDIEKFTGFYNPAFDLGKNNKCIFIDNQDKMWIGTGGKGIFSYEPEFDKYTQFGIKGDGKGTNQNIIMDITPEDDQHLLLAVNQGGINRFDKVSRTFEYITYDMANDAGLNNNGIACFHKDNEGILWIGTSGGGVNYCNPKKTDLRFSDTQGIIPDRYRITLPDVFMRDQKGLIWIGRMVEE